MKKLVEESRLEKYDYETSRCYGTLSFPRLPLGEAIEESIYEQSCVITIRG